MLRIFGLSTAYGWSSRPRRLAFCLASLLAATMAGYVFVRPVLLATAGSPWQALVAPAALLLFQALVTLTGNLTLRWTGSAANTESKTSAGRHSDTTSYHHET